MPERNNTLKTFVSPYGNLHCSRCLKLLIRRGRQNYSVTHTCLDGYTYHISQSGIKDKKVKPEPKEEAKRGLKIFKNAN